MGMMVPTKLRVLHGLPIATIVEDHHVSTAHDVRGAGLSALPACDDHHSVRQNPRSGITCLTRFETAIAAARPFLGLYLREFMWLKAQDALYNFSAAGNVRPR